MGHMTRLTRAILDDFPCAENVPAFVDLGKDFDILKKVVKFFIQTFTYDCRNS